MALGTPYTVVSDSAVVSSGNTRQATISANVAIGDTIVVFPFNNISVNAASVTDSAGHTYTQQVVQGTGNGLRVTCWTTRATAAMTSGSDWIKVTWSSTIGSTCQVGMHARACSGVATGAYVDSAGTTGTSLTGSTTPAAVSGTTARAQTSEWLLSCAQAANSSTGFGAWSGGFTQQSLQHQSGQPYVAVADQVTAATTAINGTVVETVSAAWQICQIALKADLGGATVVPLFGMDNQTALSTWNDMEAKLGTAAIKVWRGYNGPGLPASYPGHDAPVPPG